MNLLKKDKNILTVVVIQNTREMTTHEIAAEAKVILGKYPPEYAHEIKMIAADAAGHSMRVTYYTLAGIMGAGLIASFFLPRRKLVTEPVEATGPLT